MAAKSLFFWLVVLPCQIGLAHASEGGIALMGTRIIHNADAARSGIAVRNKSTADSFLIQSWVENAAGGKSKDFFVAPPLYISRPQTQNEVNIKFTGQADQLPKDRETLYYFVEKTIPSIDKSKVGKDVVLVAVATKLKLYYRPEGLKPLPRKAPEMLELISENGELKIKNPTPYYVTLVNMSVDGKNIKDSMVSPFSALNIGVKYRGNRIKVIYSSLNDFGSKVGPYEKTTD
ncbi:fimbria/pilus periplasmic chaperone [Enterobacter hormaechei]